MIDHISLKVRDFMRCKEFYAAALAPLGYVIVRDYSPHAAGIGPSGRPVFWLVASEQTAATHIAFASRDRDAVSAFFAAAMNAGARDNGPPGLREHYHPNYYGAFVLDPEGNNIEAVCHRSPEEVIAAARGDDAPRAASRAAPKRAAPKRAAPAKSAAKRPQAKAAPRRPAKATARKRR